MTNFTQLGFSRWPAYPIVYAVPVAFVNSSINATGVKIGAFGLFKPLDGSSQKSITNVQFQVGTVVSAGGSVFRVSLQTPSPASGSNPVIPLGNWDQFYDVSASFLINSTWCTGSGLNSSRVINRGDPVYVVFEFNPSGQIGSDSVTISAINSNASTNSSQGGLSYITRFPSSGSWVSLNNYPNLVFQCSDGTIATLDSAFAASNTTLTTNVGTSSTATEVGQAFSVDVPMQVYGADLLFQWPNNVITSGNLVLYSGDANGNVTSLLASSSIYCVNQGSDNTTTPQMNSFVFNTGVTLNTGSFYYLTVSGAAGAAIVIQKNGIFSSSFNSITSFNTSSFVVQRTGSGQFNVAPTASLICSLLINGLPISQ